MSEFHDNRFPGESAAYREARDALLEREMNLRRLVEETAAIRRGLPPGGKLKEDYLFDAGPRELSNDDGISQIRFSELFADGKSNLVIYSFMYGPDWEEPCPMCTSILDSLNGTAIHAERKINFVVVAKAPIQKIRAWARERGWHNLFLLSSMNNSYNLDYFGENDRDQQLPALNVFQKNRDGIFHFYNTELLFVKSEEGQNSRHVDFLWPLWNLFDMTPMGRGNDWYPSVSYDKP